MSALTDARNWALTMAGTSTTPAKEAALWLQIALEIETYLSPEDEGDGLFDDPKDGG